MIRHVVVFRWREGTTPEQVAAVRTRLAALPARIPEIRAYHLGEDLRLADGTSDFAITADFDDIDDYRTYAANPEHQTVIREGMRPLTEMRMAVQFEL